MKREEINEYLDKLVLIELEMPSNENHIAMGWIKLVDYKSTRVSGYMIGGAYTSFSTFMNDWIVAIHELKEAE